MPDTALAELTRPILDQASQFEDTDPRLHLKRNRAILGARGPELWEMLKSCIHTGPQAKVTKIQLPHESLVYRGLHLASSYDRACEADTQVGFAKIPDTTEVVTVYGVGLGDIPRRLLKEPKVKWVRCVILNTDVFAQSCLYFDHSDWLSDPRTILILGKHETILHGPFVLHPVLYHLAENSAKRIADMAFTELQAPHVREYHVRRGGLYTKRIEASWPQFKEDRDVRELIKTNTEGRAFVCAAGPTLSEWFDWIKRERTPKDTVIAVSTALKPMLKAGITPNLVVIVDPNDDMIGHFEGVDLESLSSVGLCYTLMVRHDIPLMWRGPRYGFYINELTMVEKSKELNRGIVFCSGTVLHPCCDIATFMGHPSVYLFGADLSYVDGLTHVQGATYVEDAPCVLRPTIVNGYGERVNTEPNMIGYLRDLENYILANQEIKWIKAGKKGAEAVGTTWLEDLEWPSPVEDTGGAA